MPRAVALRACVSIRSHNEAGGLDGAAKWFTIPAVATTTLGTAIFSNKTLPPNLKELVRRTAPRRIFFIHAERGQGGEKPTAEHYEAAIEPKQLWKTDSAHAGGYDAAPKEYERRVVDFFNSVFR